MDFFESSGLAVAYCEDHVHIFLYRGEPAAYFEGDCVYSYSGRHLGWRHDGWIIDHDGNYYLFSEQAQIRQFEPLRPPTSSNWSKLSAKEFFQLEQS
jgi:hypothetical protein